MSKDYYFQQLMKKSDRKQYLANKHGVFTINFPKKLNSKSRLKFNFKPGNTYILKGEKLENIDLVFNNSNVIVENIEFTDCSIQAENGIVTYYCSDSNSITKTRANKIILTDYNNHNFAGLPFVCNDLLLHNVQLYNMNNDYNADTLLSVTGNLELDNTTINISSNISNNPNQELKLQCNNLLMTNSNISTIIDNKSIKNNDNIDVRTLGQVSINIYTNDAVLENSSIESGYNIGFYGNQVVLNNSLIGSLINSETNIKKLVMNGESDIVSIKPIFWEPYISEFYVSSETNEIFYNCEKSLRSEKKHINGLSSKIEELNLVKEILTNNDKVKTEKRI